MKIKLLTVKKLTAYCDPLAYGEYCFETTDLDEWCDKQGNQQIWIKYVRSRAVICLWGIPLYTIRKQDVKLYWYKILDLPAMYLPLHITKEPGEYMLRIKRQKDLETSEEIHKKRSKNTANKEV